MCLVIDGSPETFAETVTNLEGCEDLESEWDSEEMLDVSARNSQPIEARIVIGF